MHFGKYDKNMSFLKKILIYSIFLFIFSCAEHTKYKIKKFPQKEIKYYSSSGFALVYDDILFANKEVTKKIDNEKISVMHKTLKKNTLVNISNPLNQKVIKAKVMKNADYPNIFNIVITKEIATSLELDLNNPFVEISEIKKNKIFIAKESSTFEEEKNIAEKAPINEVEMNDLSKEKVEVVKKSVTKNNFILVISDFYYENSANTLMLDLRRKINIKNIFVEKINDKKYRLFVGPFKNFNALKTTYISLNNLGFENLNVYKK
jgi:hypothetical protein